MKYLKNYFSNGFLVELVDLVTGTVIATAISDATGHYYFNPTDATWNIALPYWDANSNGVQDIPEPSGIMPNTQYTVRIAASNFNLFGFNSPWLATKQEKVFFRLNPGGPLADLSITQINTPGTLENGFIISDSEDLSVTLTTGAFGASNHTFDFGFASADWGDAPDTYGTTNAATGAYHPIISGYSMGTSINSDGDDVPTVNADGDDLDGVDDEDGVTFPVGTMLTCNNTSVDVELVNTAGVNSAFLDAWIDFDGNGVFDEPTDRIATGAVLANGVNTINFAVPCSAVAGITYARFRLSSTGGLSAMGSALDGEVEDYLIIFSPSG